MTINPRNTSMPKSPLTTSATPTHAPVTKGAEGGAPVVTPSEKPAVSSGPPNYHQDKLGEQKATPQDTSTQAMYQSKETVAALNSRRGSVFTTRSAPGTPSGAPAPELTSQTSGLHGTKKSKPQPPQSEQAFAAKHGGTLSAWVEQASDPVIQGSSEAVGVCNSLVNEWSREGLKGPSGETAFRQTLNSGDYQQFVDLQKQARFIQQQVRKNDTFLVHHDVAKNNLSVAERLDLQNQTIAHDRNVNIPGLTTRDVTPPNSAIDSSPSSNLNFAFELSKALQRDLPAEGSSAFYKLGLKDANGAGHAIGLKTEHLPGGKLEFSMLDPNSGEYTKIPKEKFVGFVKEHMSKQYPTDYQGGSWAMHRITP